MNVRIAMIFAAGTLGLIAGESGGAAAEPPPPYVPTYSAGEALARFRADACTVGLNDVIFEQATLRGFQGSDGPIVFLDLEVIAPPSARGIRCRTATSVSLDTATGRPIDPGNCAANLAILLATQHTALAAAEADPAVARFLDDHPHPDKVRATFDGTMQPQGRIVFQALGPDGGTAMHLWP